MRKIADNISLIDDISNGTSIEFIEKDFIKKQVVASERQQEDTTLVKGTNDLQVI